MKNSVLKFLWVLPALWVMASCNDNLSEVGGSIQPKDDKIRARVDSVSVDYSTMPMPSVYSNSRITLLGEIKDPFYGNFKANFISKLRHARGFKFAHKPIGGKIDSLQLHINYNVWAGDSTAILKAAVYKITDPVSGGGYSQKDLSKFQKEKNFLGSLVYTAKSGKTDTQRGLRYLSVPLSKELGQKFYDASINNPHFFDTQEAMEKELLQGLLVTTTTGSGNVLSVYGIEFRIFYSYEGDIKDKDGKTKKGPVKAVEIFANTKEQIQVNGFENSQIGDLLVPNDKFTYIKSPAGVVTKMTIKKEGLVKALDRSGKGYNPAKRWLLSEAQLKIDVEQPDPKVTEMAPPPYLILLAADSLKNFFEKNYTELTHPESAFLSTIYSIERRYYNFSNISPLISKHLKEHAKYLPDGKIALDKDLEAVIVPVQKFTVNSLDKNVTSEINNFIFPAAAKLKTSGHARKVGIISTEYNKQ